jgi:uncharacterized lipoprotein YbaY
MSSLPRPRSAYAVLALLLMLAAACTALPPVFPGPGTVPVAPPAASPAVVSAPMTGTTPIGTSEAMTPTLPAASAAPTPVMAAITGQVTYRQRIAFKPDAVVEVELQDISRADAPATIVGSQRIETQNAQVPIPFAVQYDPASINPAGSYSLRARIIENGLVTWLTANAPRVLTRGAPTDQVEIVVQPSDNPQPAAAATARLEGVVTYLERIALSPNAVVEVKLQDVSRADVAAVEVASQTIQTQGKQVPIPFSLEYDPASIDPRMTYAVSARITEDGKLTWINTTMYLVLTRGAPMNDVEIVVERVK